MSESPTSLSRAQLAEIYAHARACFPSECCGYLLGEGPGAKLVACRNRQDELHARDPERHPRDSRSAYEIGGAELLALVRSFDSPQPATLIYHSHPRVGAYFSPTDARAADAAAYPVDYLVVDVRDDGVHEARLFSRGARGWVEGRRYDGSGEVIQGER